LEQQKKDIDVQIELLQEGCDRMVELAKKAGAEV